MIDQNKYVSVLSHCIYTEGPTRGVICDLQREKFAIVPKDLGNILNFITGKRISDIYSYYGEENTIVLSEYLDFLIKNEFVFISESEEEYKRFPAIEINRVDYGLIDTCILDIGSDTTYDLVSAIGKLVEIGCKYFQVRIYFSPDEDMFQSLLLAVSEHEIINIEIFFCYSSWTEKYDFETNFILNQALSDIYIYSSPTEKQLNYFNYSFRVVFITQNLNSSKHCGVISPEYFISNTKMYANTKLGNNCLMRKIGIDSQGQIKNCPSMMKTYGHISNMDLAEIVISEEFTAISKIKKSDITICKICEFRNVCIDCRAYTELHNDIFSKPLKCGYNPFRGVWEKWSEMTDKIQAIDFYKFFDKSGCE